MQGNSYANTQLKRIAKNTSIIAAIIIAGIITLLALYAPNLQNLMMGNEFKSDMELEMLLDAKKVYVHGVADDLFYSGYTIGTDSKDEADFYLFDAGDQFVICRTKPNMPEESYLNYKIRGCLEVPTGEEARLRGMLVNDWLAYCIEEDPDLTREDVETWFAPYMIDTLEPQWLMQLVIIAAFALIVYALVRVALALGSVNDNSMSKWYKKLSFNGTEIPSVVNESISEELASDNVVSFNKVLRITENWIVSQSTFAFKVRKKSDLLWMHKTVTQHRTNGIPTGKTYAIALKFADKTMESTVARNEADMDNVMSLLMLCCPNVISGYSPELQEIYSKDIAGFIEMARKYAAQNEAPTDEAPVNEAPVDEEVAAAEQTAEATTPEENPETDI